MYIKIDENLTSVTILSPSFVLILFCQLQNRPHFVENSDMYSLQDLIDTEDGTLLAELASIHGDYAVHIRLDCQVSSFSFLLEN